MKCRAYSLVEVMIAAGIVAIGLSAATVLVGTLMTQQEINAASLRAANLQEQAIRLYRLGMLPTEIPGLLPEASLTGVISTDGKYAIDFGVSEANTFEVDDGTEIVETVVEVTPCTMIYPNPAGVSGFVTNTISVVRPTIRAF
jgi:prepilin-type N-terminal cleavage/methylation domain-containing protein